MKEHKKWQVLLLVVLSACNGSSTDGDDRWEELFDGETLNGWTVVHGDLPFAVRQGEIVGATAVDVATRYLTTVGRYDDFILELEVNNSDGDNSGVQFRSVADAPFYAGLTGYQLEIDPSDRAWTGGIYFEGVGEWAHAPLHNPECQAAWRQDGWNKLRIEARGKQMRTFVNGTACAYLFDDYLSEGHIGLQIHSIGADSARAGAETRWRNIRILDNPANGDFSPDDLSADANSRLIGRLSPNEEAAGWRLARSLVASDTDGWGEATITNPITLATQQAMVLDLVPDGEVATASIPLAGSFFELIADVQFELGTAGEIRYPISGTDEYGNLVACGGSYRIFDDRSLDVRSSDDSDLMGSLTGTIAAENLSEPGRDKRVLYGDAWRRLELRVGNGSVEHWLNSVKVVEFRGCDVAAAAAPYDDSIEFRIDQGRAIFRTIKLRLEEK